MGLASVTGAHVTRPQATVLPVSHVFIEVFVEIWNYRAGRASSH